MDYRALLSSIHTQHNAMVEQLHQFCAINSGTTNFSGLKKMHSILQSAYEPLADTVQTRPLSSTTTMNMDGQLVQQHYGDALFISKRPHLKKRILLSGHMDTVFAENSPFQELTYINDNCVNGPGVADMKGGLIVMLQALAAFEKTPYANELGWDVFINSDEEVGSPSSSLVFKEIAQRYQIGLVYEPAMTETGMLAKNRKGSGKLTLIARGKSAHAGRDFAKGKNAICYLAEAILDINKLNGLREGVTINVGKVAGGEALNIVPDCAGAQLDIRISHADDELWVRKELDKILAGLKRKGYTLNLHGRFERPVKRINQATKNLFLRIQAIGQELGLSIGWKNSGGCCDGNNLAQQGLAVMDTLGVRGGSIHSTNEYILLDSLVERTCLSALILADIAQQNHKDISI